VTHTSGSGSFGIFQQSGDVGGPAITGSTTFNAAGNEYTLVAGGVNMWGIRDEFQFVWTELSGDFAIEARVEFLGSGVEPHRKAGCIIRPSFDADGTYVDAALHGDGLTALQYRRTKGGLSEHVVAPIKGADVIRLERRGETYKFAASRSGSGERPAMADLAGVTLGNPVYVGLFLCSHNGGVTERAIFRDVVIHRA
jgi:TolB protein